MSPFDLDAPATLHWITKDEPRTRHFTSLRGAVRVAMKELTRTEFFSAHVATGDDRYAGDQIAQIFQTGTLARPRYAGF